MKEKRTSGKKKSSSIIVDFKKPLKHPLNTPRCYVV